MKFRWLSGVQGEALTLCYAPSAAMSAATPRAPAQFGGYGRMRKNRLRHQNSFDLCSLFLPLEVSTRSQNEGIQLIRNAEEDSLDIYENQA